MYFGQTANIQITNPKSVVLYNRGGSVFSFGNGSTLSPNVINIQTEMLRMWNIATTPLSITGSANSLANMKVFYNEQEET